MTQYCPVFTICQNHYSNYSVLYSLLIPGVSFVITNIILPNQSSVRVKFIPINEAIVTIPLEIYLENSQKAIFYLLAQTLKK